MARTGCTGRGLAAQLTLSTAMKGQDRLYWQGTGGTADVEHSDEGTGQAVLAGDWRHS